MSAFLYFSQGKRSQIKESNPDMKNTEISQVLGEQWRNLNANDRSPFVDMEKIEREKYKKCMAEWKIEHEKSESNRKAQAMDAAEQSAYANESQQVMGGPLGMSAHMPGFPPLAPPKGMFPGQFPSVYHRTFCVYS
jgi:hypothetical protein